MKVRLWIFLIVVAAALAAPAVNAQTPPSGDRKILEKLDQIVQTQQQILQELASVKEELAIIKVRSTR